MSQGLDANNNLTDYAGHLADLGFNFVGRYINPGKAEPLTTAEINALTAHDIYAVSIWEQGSPTSPLYFQTDRGVSDGDAAVTAAQSIGQPAGTPIYFAVDYDASPGDLPSIASYFSAVHQRVRSAGYFVGVYGSGIVCRDLSEIGWVSKTFAGYDDWKDKADIVQGVETRILGLDVDLDTANGDAGGWMAGNVQI